MFGLVFGSFLNVCIYRLPRELSVVRPGSACPQCGQAIHFYDNIPVLSWLLLRGRCRHCATGISASYPVVELCTGLLYAAVVLAKDDTRDIVLGLLLVTVLVPVTLIDLEHRIIPNRITAPGAILALVIGLSLDPGGEPERLIAGASAGGFLLLAALAYPGGMGMGDVKLAGVMGLFLGRAVAPALLVALLAGVLAGAAVIARNGAREGRKTAVPFGPFLALGAVVAVFAGQDLVGLYLNHFL